MYAALLPHAANPDAAQALEQLNTCFANNVVYYLVLDHTVRGALVFDRFAGFDDLPNFPVTENWIVNNETIDALKAFSTDTFANVEISAQLLLAAMLSNREHLVPGLRQELEKWVCSIGRAGNHRPHRVHAVCLLAIQSVSANIRSAV